MKKLFNKKAFALLLCLVLALTALLTVTAFAATCEMAENDIEQLLSYVNDRYYSPAQV